MKVNNNSIFVGDDTRSIRHGEKQVKKQTKKQVPVKSVNAKDLRIKLDPIAEKRKEARKAAMDIVGKVFAGERKIDDELNGRRKRISDLRAENAKACKEISEYENRRLELRNQYGVTPDSQEERDLRLLEKELDSRRPDSQVTLTEDDYSELERIREEGLSEYQERSLEIRGYEGPAKDTIYHNKLEMQTETAIITQTELERLKSHALLDAQEQAEDIMDAAAKEIVGMLVDEAKEHIDDESEEIIEDAKEKAKEKKELEERITKVRDEKKEKEEITEDILEGAADVSRNTTELDNAQQEIKDMMSKMKLIEEDIKGAAVDKTL